jgi:hypothetical protein
MTKTDYPSDFMLVIPIAIRPDHVVRIHIPADLTKDEADRIASVIMGFVHPSSQTKAS